MWPWEHVAVAYLLVSLGARAFDYDPPTDAVALVVVAGALFPDLVDKPLGWVLGVLPGGRTLAHSLLVAVPVSALAIALARRHRRTALGVAFAVAYLSHLPLDSLASGLDDGTYETGFLLWPLYASETGSTDAIVFHVAELFDQFVTYLASPRGRLYVVFEIALLATSAIAWWRDGRPGPQWVVRQLRGTGESGSPTNRSRD